MASVAYWKLSNQFLKARKQLFWFAIAATVGMGLFVWASSPQSEQATPGSGPKLTINLNGVEGNPISNSAFDKVGAPIGPFQTGKSDRLEGEPSSGPSAICKSDPLESIVNKVQNKPLRRLLVIGSADKFELNSSLRTIYGSNEGPAQARADQIPGCLSNYVSTDVALTTVRGPSVHGSAAKESDTGGDRSVAVYVVWAQSLDHTQ